MNKIPYKVEKGLCKTICPFGLTSHTGVSISIGSVSCDVCNCWIKRDDDKCIVYCNYPNKKIKADHKKNNKEIKELKFIENKKMKIIEIFNHNVNIGYIMPKIDYIVFYEAGHYLSLIEQVINYLKKLKE